MIFPVPLTARELFAVVAVLMVVGIGYGMLFPPEEIEEERLEAQIHAEINEERTRAGLYDFSHNARLRSNSRSYSKEMARHNFISHDSPVSGSLGERVSCEPAAENINTAYWATEFEDGSGNERFIDNQTEMATYIVHSWLRSSGHRENVLSTRMQSHGIGVNVTEKNDHRFVIVTQQLCG